MEKRVFRSFRYSECDDFAAFLSKMASEGWHFKGWRFGLIFEKGEPEEVVYSVQIFVKGSDMDLKATADTEEYAEYCKEAGWEYIDASRKFVVFKKISEDAVDIVTPEERFKEIVNVEIKNTIISLIGSIILLGIYIKNYLCEGFYYTIFYYSMFVIIFIFFIGVVANLCQLIKNVRWYMVSKKKLSYGEKIVFGIGEREQRKKDLKGKIFTIGIEVFLICVFALESNLSTVMVVVLFGGLFLFCTCFVEYLRPNKVAGGISYLGICVMVPILLYMFISVNPITDDIYTDKTKAPLLQEDYREVDAPFMQVEINESETIFGSIETYHITYYKHSENPDDEIWDDIDYTIIESEYDWIIDHSWNVLTTDLVNPKNIAKEWGAVDGIREYEYFKSYYLKYDHQIFMFKFAPGFTQEQIDIIREKLNLGQVI